MRTLVVMGGGTDSAVCLAKMVREYGPENVAALTFYYGQRHKIEVEAAKRVADFYGVETIVKDFGDFYKGSKCELIKESGREVTEGSFEEQISKSNGAPVATFVPFRNGFFYSAAAVVAMINGFNSVAHAIVWDGTIGNAHPDASGFFTTLIADAIYVGTGGAVEVLSPFITIPKYEVIKIGKSLGVPFELTYSCYGGEDKSCGKCGSCIQRLSAFEKAGTRDPLAYK